MSEFQDTKSRETQLLQLLAENSKSAISAIYREFKSQYLGFIRRYNADEEMHLESFHDAILVFYKIYKNGKYKPENASMKTLIFAIGKKKLFQKFRDQKKLSEREVSYELDVNLLRIVDKEVVWNERDERLKGAFSDLSGSCREILTLFYYHRYSIDAIMHELGHANENVTKSHKSRCLAKLRSIFKSTKG